MTKKPKLRKFLYEAEISSLIEVTKNTGWPLRNELIVTLTCRHGLRAGETCNLQWSDIDFNNYTLDVKRQKSGVDCLHPLISSEIELLLRHKEGQKFKSPYVFHSTHKKQMTTDGLYWLITKWGRVANIDVHVHTHMLRHTSATTLINLGISLELIKGWMGHSSIKSTEIYTHLDQRRFKNIFEGSIFA